MSISRRRWRTATFIVSIFTFGCSAALLYGAGRAESETQVIAEAGGEKITIENAISEYDIEATEPEIKWKIREMRPTLKIDPEEVVSQEQKLHLHLACAIEDVIKNPDEPKRVYDRHLKGVIPFATWKGILNTHKTAEELEKFAENVRNSVPQDISEIYRSMWASARSWVIMDKLKAKVAQDVEISMEEVREEYEQWKKGRAAAPSFKDVKKKLRRELITQQKESRFNRWLRDRYSECDIKIIDEKYKTVKKYLYKRVETEKEDRR